MTGKPPLTIDLIAPEGNVFALIEKACMTLEQTGQVEQSQALSDWFYVIPPFGSDATYEDVKHMVEQYCAVTWIHPSATPRSTSFLFNLIPKEVRESVWIDPSDTSHLQCNICEQNWWLDGPNDENKPMPRGWWKCPNGCWNDGLVQRMKEEGRLHDYNKIYVD